MGMLASRENSSDPFAPFSVVSAQRRKSGRTIAKVALGCGGLRRTIDVVGYALARSLLVEGGGGS